MARRQARLQAVEPDLADLLPTAGARAAFEDASAAIEAGLLVRDLRKDAGLTQAALANRLGITQARVSAIEKGEGRDGPSYALLKRIAMACGTAWPLGVTPAARARWTLSRRMSQITQHLYRLQPGSEMVILETAPGTHSSRRKWTPVLDAAGRRLGRVLQVVVETRQGAKFATVHYDQHKAAFVSGASSEEEASGTPRKSHGRLVES